MNRKPVLVSVRDKSSNLIELLYFPNTRDAKNYLRKNGCQFSNYELCDIGDDMVRLKSPNGRIYDITEDGSRA